MSKQIEIRFLQPGMLKIEAPDNWEELDDDEKQELCTDAISSADHKTLVTAMSDFIGLDVDNFFSATPRIEAVSTADTKSGERINEAASEAWVYFKDDSIGLLWNHYL